MDLSIVLVNWNGKVLLEQCLRSLEASETRCSYEIIISDNASTDGSQEWLRHLEQVNPRVRCVLNADNLGFGVGNNRALPFCQGRYVLFLNTDTIVLEPLDALVAEADRLGPRCGALGGRVLNQDGSLQLSCRDPYTLPILIAGLTLAYAGFRPRFLRRQQLTDWDHASAREVATLSGCYLLISLTVLRQVGGFDPDIFLYFEDTDLCYRIRQAGYAVRYAPVSTIIHLEGGTSRSKGLTHYSLSNNATSAIYFTRRYLGRWQAYILTLSVRVSWALMWCAFGLLGLTMPIPKIRKKARSRARLLGAVLPALSRRPGGASV